LDDLLTGGSYINNRSLYVDDYEKFERFPENVVFIFTNTMYA